MRLKEIIEKRKAEEGGTPCYETGADAQMLSLEWRSGKRRALPWARLIDATLEDGELLLSFVGREVTFYGLNLGDLLDSVVERRLVKVWELPDDYRPPATLTRPFVNKIEVDDSEWEHLPCEARCAE